MIQDMSSLAVDGPAPSPTPPVAALAASSRRVRLVRSFSFEAAHWLPHVPPGHQCARMHGHSFHVDMICEGETDVHAGWLLDFARIKQAAAPWIDRLDHRCLNEIEGLSNPTAEEVARWLWMRIRPHLPELAQINLAETCTARCEYRG